MRSRNTIIPILLLSLRLGWLWGWISNGLVFFISLSFLAYLVLAAIWGFRQKWAIREGQSMRDYFLHGIGAGWSARG